MNYDVIIVGAGPGGIFAAYELKMKRPELKVGVFEAGYALSKRRCPIDGEKVKSCIGCKTCSIRPDKRFFHIIKQYMKTFIELCNLTTLFS